MKRLKVYFGHKLTNASPEFVNRMVSVRDSIERLIPCEVLKFLGASAGTCADVYDVDIVKNIASCDLFVAVLDGESTGLGIELGAALWLAEKPILMLSSEGVRASRLAIGLAERNPDRVIHRIYRTDLDAVDRVAEAIETFCLRAAPKRRSAATVRAEDALDPLEMGFTMRRFGIGT